MNDLILKKCEKLVQATQLLKRASSGLDSLTGASAALLLLDTENMPSQDKIKTAEKILKEKTGVFSEFRGNIKVYLVCKMMLSGEPEKYFDEVSKIYHMLNTSKLFGSEYKIIAAMSVYEHTQAGNIEEIVAKTQEIYGKMKEKHPFLTSDEDMPFAAMLAVTDMSVDSLIDEMEKDYQALKKKFGDLDALQSLTHVMSCSEMSSEVRCSKICEIYDRLKAAKHKFGQSYSLASLGVFSMLNIPAEEIVSEIIEADDYLSKQKGFGDFSIGSDMRRMYAAQVVYSSHSEDKNGAGIALGSVLAYTIAVELCVIALLC